MNVHEQIKAYIATQPEPKRSDMQELHGIILELMPDCTLWFLDGKDEKGQTVSNPNIGYGFQTIRYADGKTRAFYQIGISANTTGISVYILGIEDKKYLAETCRQASNSVWRLGQRGRHPFLMMLSRSRSGTLLVSGSSCRCSLCRRRSPGRWR